MIDSIDPTTADADNSPVLDGDVQAVTVGVQHRSRLHPPIY
jgi:hypothetical protein